MNKISEEPFGQDPDIWHIVTDQGVDELINSYPENLRFAYSPFYRHRHFV